MLAVSPLIPAEAPRAVLAAVRSMLDRPVLTLLTEALASSTSTRTTRSSLLSDITDCRYVSGADGASVVRTGFYGLPCQPAR